MIKKIIAKLINWACADEIVTVGSIKIMHPHTIFTDSIQEKTPGAGVTVTGVRSNIGTEAPDQFPNAPIVGQMFYATDTKKLYVQCGGTVGQITGDVATFTGQANDKIKVTIDSIIFDNIDISACTSIAEVVTAINTIVGAVRASVSTGFLRITSPNMGGASNVTIADGSGTGQPVVGELFTVPGNRTSTGVSEPGCNSKGWFNLKYAQYSS